MLELCPKARLNSQLKEALVSSRDAATTTNLYLVHTPYNNPAGNEEVSETRESSNETSDDERGGEEMDKSQG